MLSSCENRLSVNGLERLHPIPPKRHRHLGLTESVNEKLYELNFRTMCTISGSPSNGNRNFCRAHARALATRQNDGGRISNRRMIVHNFEYGTLCEILGSPELQSQDAETIGLSFNLS